MKIEYRGHKDRANKAHRLWRAMAIAYMPIEKGGEGLSVQQIINDPRFKKADGTKYNRAYVYQVFAKLNGGEVS